MTLKKVKTNHFMFRKFGDKFLVTNAFGRYSVLDRAAMETLANGKAAPESEIGNSLKEKGFIYSEEVNAELASMLKEKWSYLFRGPVLHIMIMTLRCNHICRYCQASRAPMDQTEFDMPMAIADKVVDTIFRSPSDTVTIEFQGGEPLANWDGIVHVVERAKELIQETGKYVMFSLVSNLSLMDGEKLNFIIKNNIQVSTSLDGPMDLHNKNRVFPDGNSYEETTKWIRRINQAYKENGKEDIVYRVEALPTVTKATLGQAGALVDEYVAQGMKAIFLRPINPFGFAVNTAKAIGYSTGEFLKFYEQALDYIIELNLNGTQIVERFAAIFLTKILKADDPNYLDIRSPCGAGIGQLAYNFDGKVYTCDEGRMVARMGDEAFQIGDVMQDGYNDLVTHPIVRALATASTLDSIPSCATCAYRPYCGTCPVVNYCTQGSIFPQSPTNVKCRLHMGILDMLFQRLIKGDPKVMEVFDRWVTVRERPEYYVHDEIFPSLDA